MSAATVFTIGTEFLSLRQISDILEHAPKLELSGEVLELIDRGARYAQQLSVGPDHVYGTNTGFGALCEKRIGDEEINKLQYNLLVSHAAGIGAPVSERLSRIVLLNKLLTFRFGNTGITVEVARELVRFWNEGVIPVIPSKGTVGASGDLAPLAHFGLPLINLGNVHYKGEIRPAREVKEDLNWKPVTLKAKEGLALVNGIQYIDAHAVDALLQIEKYVVCADILAALSIQGFSASSTFYHPRYHETSFHPERKDVAGNLCKLLNGSNHFELPTCNRSKQDPYSFRCIPQVHGAVRQVIRHAYEVIERDVNSVSDNPLFFPEENLVLFGGNLHGESTAIQLDCLAIAVSELASISERRTYQLLSGCRGLPDFLVEKPGINSGLMIPQYTAAAMVNYNKVLATPASIDTIPTSQLQEDHVSMGGTSALKLGDILWNTKYVFGIELMTAVQAINLNKGLTISPICNEIVNKYRAHVSYLAEDRVMADDIEKSVAFLDSQLDLWSRMGLKSAAQQSTHNPR